MTPFKNCIPRKESATTATEFNAVPTVTVSLPTNCTTTALVRTLSGALGLLDVAARPVADTAIRLSKFLSDTRINLIIVDEYPHVLPDPEDAAAAPSNRRRELCNVLSHMCDATGTDISVEERPNPSAARGISVRELRSYWAMS